MRAQTKYQYTVELVTEVCHHFKSCRAVAEICDVHMQTIYRWKVFGIPERAADTLSSHPGAPAHWSIDYLMGKHYKEM